jgi:hypothetical protein
MNEQQFANLANGGKAIERLAREAFAAFGNDDIESCLDSLEGIVSDCDIIRRKAKEIQSELELGTAKRKRG